MKDVYKKILVAVDYSEEAQQAVHEAVAIAKRNDSSLFVLHVKDVARLSSTPAALAISLEGLEEEFHGVSGKVATIINDEVEFEIHGVSGNPKKEIVRFAKDFDIDLIVIGANSKGLIDRILVGSTTSYVVSHAPCNVMVIK